MASLSIKSFSRLFHESFYIYQNYFALDPQTYSYYFAVNSAFAILGPVLYIRSIGSISARSFAWSCLLIVIASSISVFIVGVQSPFFFMLTFLPFTLIEGAIRPFSTNILLDQQSEDIGSASSLINAVHTILGSIGMLLGSLAWSNIVHGLGVIMLAASVIATIIFVLLLRSSFKIKGL